MTKAIIAVFARYFKRRMTLNEMLDYNLNAGYLALTWDTPR